MKRPGAYYLATSEIGIVPPVEGVAEVAIDSAQRLLGAPVVADDPTNFAVLSLGGQRRPDEFLQGR